MKEYLNKTVDLSTSFGNTLSTNISFHYKTPLTISFLSYISLIFTSAFHQNFFKCFHYMVTRQNKAFKGFSRLSTASQGFQQLFKAFKGYHKPLILGVTDLKKHRSRLKSPQVLRNGKALTRGAFRQNGDTAPKTSE